MKIHQALDNISHFLIPTSVKDKDQKPCTRRLSWAVAIITGIATVGIAQGLCALWLKFRRIPLNPQQERIQEVFNQNVQQPWQPGQGQEILPNPPLVPAEMVAMRDFIKLHHNNTRNLLHFRTLGSPWCAWYDENSGKISLQIGELFLRRDTQKKIDLQILDNGETSIRNNMPTILSEDYSPILKNLSEEFSTLRYLAAPGLLRQPQNANPRFNLQRPQVPLHFNNLFDQRFEVQEQFESFPLDFIDDELIENEDQPIPKANSKDEACKISCPQDWTLFKTILARRLSDFEFLLGSFGYFSVGLSGPQQDVITITKKLGPDLPPTPPPDDILIKIQIDAQGQFASFMANEKQLLPTEFIPKEYYPIINACFKKTLELACRYKNSLGTIKITAPRRSLSKIPEHHLQQLYKVANSIHITGEHAGLEINFLGDDLKKEEGADAGGLSRQYIEDIIKNFIHCRTLNLFKCHTGLAMPSQVDPDVPLTAQEKDLYYSAGYLMGCAYVTPPIKSGIYFDDTLFRTILACSGEDIDKSFDELSEDAKLRFAEAIVESRVDIIGANDPVNKFFNCVKLLKEQINLANKPLPNNEEDLQKHKEQIQTSEGNLQEALINAGVNYLKDPTLDTFVDRDEDELKFDEIKANKENFLKLFNKAIFNYSDKAYGQIKAQLAPIHTIAQGMNAVISLFETDWNTLKGKGHKDLADKVQGSCDRQKIVDNILIKDGDANAHLLEKTKWLKEWILDKNTSNKHVGLFLKFVTGLTTLSDKPVKISAKYENPFTPLPVAHTCSSNLELSPQPSELRTSTGIYSDRTKEGFIKLLTDLVLKEENMGFHIM